MKMEEVDILLTDEYVEFAKKVADIHTKKKTNQAEFKEVYDKFKADLAALDVEVAEEQSKFESWKSSVCAQDAQKEKKK